MLHEFTRHTPRLCSSSKIQIIWLKKPNCLLDHLPTKVSQARGVHLIRQQAIFVNTVHPLRKTHHTWLFCGYSKGLWSGDHLWLTLVLAVRGSNWWQCLNSTIHPITLSLKMISDICLDGGITLDSLFIYIGLWKYLQGWKKVEGNERGVRSCRCRVWIIRFNAFWLIEQKYHLI